MSVSLTIANAIADDTHLIVRLMTYKQYDDEYPQLKAKYDELNPTVLSNEYDQAEREF